MVPAIRTVTLPAARLHRTPASTRQMMTLGRIGKPVVKQAIADTGRSLLPVSAKWLLIHAIRSVRPTLRRQEVGLGHTSPQRLMMMRSTRSRSGSRGGSIMTAPRAGRAAAQGFDVAPFAAAPRIAALSWLVELARAHPLAHINESMNESSFHPPQTIRTMTAKINMLAVTNSRTG